VAGRLGAGVGRLIAQGTGGIDGVGCVRGRGADGMDGEVATLLKVTPIATVAAMKGVCSSGVRHCHWRHCRQERQVIWHWAEKGSTVEALTRYASALQ
jgi:hypothetical protein